MGKSEDEERRQRDGDGDYDHRTTKPVEEAGGGKHSKDDRGDDPEKK